jgi:hypothetical protein
VDDREAKLLLATLNRLEGQDLPIRRAQLAFPAEEIADQLMAEAEEREKTLPVVIHFVVSHEQADLIDSAIERASDGVAGRDRKAQGLTNLAKHFLGGAAITTIESRIVWRMTRSLESARAANSRFPPMAAIDRCHMAQGVTLQRGGGVRERLMRAVLKAVTRVSPIAAWSYVRLP